MADIVNDQPIIDEAAPMALECDPNVEDCAIAAPAEAAFYAAQSSEFLTVFAGVSFLNLVFTQLYYNLSSDYTGQYVDRNPMSYYDKETPTVSRRRRGSGGKPKKPKRSRGQFDDDVWHDVAVVHEALWGTSWALYGLQRVTGFGFVKSFYAFYIRHIMSNMAPLVYLWGTLNLLGDAVSNADWQAFAEVFMYFGLFTVAAQFVEMINGVPALQHLDQNYPHDDALLLPSILYAVGILEHVPRNDQVDLEDLIFDEPRENDPSAEDDEIIIF